MRRMRKLKQFISTFFFLLLFLVVVAMFFAVVIPGDKKTNNIFGKWKNAANIEATYPWYGLCKKDFVQSVGDLKKIIYSDSNLRTYYKNINMDNLRTVYLTGKYHVSYRKDGEIYNTRKKLEISADETIYTDGNIFIRGHCCNKISAMIAPPFHNEEPPEEALQPTKEEAFPPALPGLKPPQYPQYHLLPPQYRADIPDISNPTIITPELSTIYYVVPGIMMIIGIILMMKKNKE